MTPLGGVELGGALKVARGGVFDLLRPGGIAGGEARLVAPGGQQLASLWQIAQMPVDERKEVIGLPGPALSRGPFKDGDRFRPEREDELG